MSRQKGLRFYRPLMDYEFGTHLEFLFALWLGLPRWMRSVEMDQHHPAPVAQRVLTGYQRAVIQEAKGKGGTSTTLGGSARGSASWHLCLCVHLDACTDTGAFVNIKLGDSQF